MRGQLRPSLTRNPEGLRTPTPYVGTLKVTWEAHRTAGAPNAARLVATAETSAGAA